MAGRKRLLHFQTIGHSNATLPGRVSPLVCDPATGWNVHVDRALEPLVERLGDDAFDWWGHNPGGVWDDLIPLQLTETTPTTTLFEQMEVARERFPKLVDYTPLAAFANQHGITLHAYIGLPRCDVRDSFVFTPIPEHGQAEHFMRWYGELVQHGFKSIGHDFSAALPEGSAALAVNFPMLVNAGIEPIVESVPWRVSTRFHGLSVVAEEHLWENAQAHPDILTDAEIRGFGGRAIHLVIRRGRDPEPSDIQSWRFNKASELLAEGKTVAVPLDQLMNAGFPVEQLVGLSRLQLAGGGP
ncbi:MAG: hypothetical protein GY715_03405 [Planctomycetes bacterium]|nr:hypothetical protein [Planctomycetota bacterium]